MEQLQKPSLVDEPETPPIETASLDYEDTWMAPIYEYLQTGSVPEDDLEADRLSRKAKMYTLVEGVLYKRGTQGVLMRCIPQSEGLILLHDIHSGICGTHASYRTLVGKAFRQGFYWPTALYDAKELVKKCVQCQFHSRQIHQPAQALQTIPLSWPFEPGVSISWARSPKRQAASSSFLWLLIRSQNGLKPNL